MPRPADVTPAEPGLPIIDVVVGIVVDSARRVLIGQRPVGKHLAGQWEFPGGKIARGETPRAALERELAEEIGIAIAGADPLLAHEFEYPDRKVRLDVWWVDDYSGDAIACENQQLRWVDAVELESVDILPADKPIVRAIIERLGAPQT